jgi:transcriptional regulator with XRE-family HTH domain
MTTFGERLRELRQRVGLSQAQLAEASDLPVGSIRNYEQGIREPYWAVIFKLAAALRVSADAFAGCDSNIKPKRGGKPRGRPRKGGAA